jgi:hypothetical protein
LSSHGERYAMLGLIRRILGWVEFDLHTLL